MGRTLGESSFVAEVKGHRDGLEEPVLGIRGVLLPRFNHRIKREEKRFPELPVLLLTKTVSSVVLLKGSTTLPRIVTGEVRDGRVPSRTIRHGGELSVRAAVVYVSFCCGRGPKGVGDTVQFTGI